MRLRHTPQEGRGEEIKATSKMVIYSANEDIAISKNELRLMLCTRKKEGSVECCLKKMIHEERGGDKEEQ